jgi:hypothetical protein
MESLVSQFLIELLIFSVELISCSTFTPIVMLEVALIINDSVAVVASTIIREDELLGINCVHWISSPS